MVNFLKNTFQNTKSYWKMILFIFLVNLTIASVFGIFTFKKLEVLTGNSTEFEKLVSDFDFTIISDFLRNEGKDLRSLLSVSLLLSSIYLLLNIFFSGGIIQQFYTTEPFKINEFIKNSTANFLKFFLLFLIIFVFLLVILLIGLFIYFGFTIAADGSTERGYFWWMTIPTTIIALLTTSLLTISDLAKNIMIKNPFLNPWEGFRIGFRYLFSNPATLKYYWAMILISLLLLTIYSTLNSLLGMTSGFTIFLMILVQQIYIFIKVFMKTWFLNNASTFLQQNPIPVKDEPKTSEIDFNTNLSNI